MAYSEDDTQPSSQDQIDTQKNSHADLQVGSEDISFGLAPGAGSTSYLGR